MDHRAQLLMAAALIYLCTFLSPAACSPAFLKPEGSYSPKHEKTIKLVDDLVNQFLKQLAISLGKIPTPVNEENDYHEAEKPHAGEVSTPQHPSPTYVPPVTPGQADGSSEGGSQDDLETHSTNGPVNNGRIVFPSD